MCLRCLSFFAISLLPFAIKAQGVLRVCADPNNMPFSNQRQEGFENKLAQMIAADVSAKLDYAWWSERGSLVKNTLNAGRCDVLMGVPSSLDEAATSKPYYRSTYVFVSRRDRQLHVTSLGDARLSDWRIGLHVVGENLAPPAVALASRGITKNVTGYSLFGAYGEENPPRRLIDAVESRDVDLAIVWGPFAGYFAKCAKVPLEITPVQPRVFSGIPFSYDISLGVRKGNEALRRELNDALDREQGAIRGLLAQYGVPEVH